jgi:serine/threonine protein kinase
MNSREPVASDRIVGDYRLIDDALGAGAAGEVWLATPQVIKDFAAPGDLLALKLYKQEILEKPNELDRIEREFKFGKTLRDPSVVRMHDYSLDPGQPFLVMEYIDGSPLNEWIRMFHPVSSVLLFQIVDQLLDALEELHSLEIIHRDVKPANAMVCIDFTAKLMDLGVIHVPSESEDLTQTGEFLGTLRNASPELLRAKKVTDYDTRTDLYSLGTVIYFLLHGREVFSEVDQPAELLDAVMHTTPSFDERTAWDDEVRAALLGLAKSLLSKDPGGRPDSVEEVREKLDRVRESHLLAGEHEPIHGYIATALTDVSPAARGEIEFASLAIAHAAKRSNIYVHQPRLATDPLRNKSIEPKVVYRLDRRKVEHADVVFALLNEKSFGVGQEIEIAAYSGKPMIVMHRPDVAISRMVRGTFANLLGDPITYDGPEELIRKLESRLDRHRGTIERFRRFCASTPPLQIGEHLRSQRIAAGFASGDAFARHHGLAPSLVEAIENGRFRNVGLLFLSNYLRALGMALVDLLKPIDSVSQPMSEAERASLAELETLAKQRQGLMSAAGYLALREEYLVEPAARSGSQRVTKKEWARRYGVWDQQQLDLLS